MKPVIAVAASVLLCAAAPGAESMGNPQIDYSGFLDLTEEVEDYRRSRLLAFEDFKAKATQPGVLVLDARSESAYRAGHIKGAVNLPFTDFTAASLAAAIGNKDRTVLIYCNNNFSNDVAPVTKKAVELALNIQTFVNLVGYGYRNVYEMNEVVDFNDPDVEWVVASDQS